MAEIWRSIKSWKRRSWGRGFEHLLECGHVEVREQRAKTRFLICASCSTPPVESGHQLSDPSSPSPIQSTGLVQDIGRELDRLGIAVVVARTPKGMLLIDQEGRPTSVGDPEALLEALRALDWAPDGEELARLAAGEAAP